MKHVAILALVVTTLLLAFIPTSNATWLSYREDISISSGTIDFNIESVNVTYTSGEVSNNISLPCNLTNLDATSVFRVNTSGTNITFNYTVNGVAINESSNVNWATGGGNWSNISIADVIAGGVDGDATYVSYAFNATGTCTIYGLLYADDAPITSSWLTSNVAVQEKDLTDAYVATKASRSFFTVNDSITVSNDNSFGYTVTDVNLTPTFPDQTITETETYFQFASISDGSSSTQYTNYQKRGPYVFKVNEKSDGAEIYVYSYEVLTNCVDFEIMPDDEEYDGALDGINYNTLQVVLDGSTQDWTEGSVDLSDITVKESYSKNKLELTWTETAVPTEIQFDEEETYFGLSFMSLMSIVIASVLVVIVVLLIVKKNY